MEQKLTNFEQQLAFGKEGEHEVGEYYMSINYSILPLYQFDDKIAPKIFTTNSSITSPDLFISGNNKYFWVEVKTKNRWIDFNGLQTGCNYEHYLQYLEVKKITGMPVYLVFNHKNIPPLGKFIIEIETIPFRIWDGYNENNGNYVTKPLVLWKYEQLTKL